MEGRWKPAGDASKALDETFVTTWFKKLEVWGGVAETGDLHIFKVGRDEICKGQILTNDSLLQLLRRYRHYSDYILFFSSTTIAEETKKRDK